CRAPPGPAPAPAPAGRTAPPDRARAARGGARRRAPPPARRRGRRRAGRGGSSAPPSPLLDDFLHRQQPGLLEGADVHFDAVVDVGGVGAGPPRCLLALPAAADAVLQRVAALDLLQAAVQLLDVLDLELQFGDRGGVLALAGALLLGAQAL